MSSREKKTEKSVLTTTSSLRSAPSHTWRRLHAGNIIAEVNPNQGMGFWRVSAYRVNGRASEVAYTGKTYSLLIDAHRGADELAQREFSHECQPGVCGKWLPWAAAGGEPPRD
jgi:hypothetical protein